MAFPKIEAEIDALLQIWFERLENHAERYGLITETVRQVKTDYLVFHHNIICASLLEQDNAEFYAYKNNCAKGDPKGTSADFPVFTLPPQPTLQVPAKPGIIPRNMELYNYLKNHPNRTDESLADLGITTTPSAPISPENKKAVISGKAVINDRVELAFNKQGMTAVRFQMRRGNGDWVTVGDPTSSPFIDTTPSIDGKPEKREYRAIYLVKNEPVGQYSDIITIYTTP